MRVLRAVLLRFCSALLGALLLLIACALPAQAQRAPSGAETTLADALKLYQNRHYVQAIDAFGAFRTQHPDHIDAPETYFYEAQSLLALDRANQAARLLRQLQRRHPSHPLAKEARLSLSQYFLQQGAYDQARATLQAVIDETDQPDEAARALYQLGTLSRQQGNLGAARSYFQRVVSRYPNASIAPDALYAAGSVQVAMDQYDAAAASFEQLNGQYPDSPYVQSLGLALANVYYELGNYERVVDEVERRMASLEGEAQERATFLLAEAYNRLRDSENAIVYYQRFTEDNPDSPYYRPALYGLAWNYHYEGTYQWAADRFARVHAGHSDSLARKAIYYEAANRQLANQTDEALALYEEYVSQYPEAALADQAQYEIGMLRYRQRDWAAARAAFATVIADHPRSPRRGEAYYMRGNTAIALNNFDEALESYNAAIERGAAPDSLQNEIVFQKAWLLYSTEAYAEAAPAFVQIYEQDDTRRREDALFWGAESFFQTSNLGRAQALFREYLNTYPDGEHASGARYALGWTQFRQQDYPAAARNFERFLNTRRGDDGDVPYRQDALLRLADSYYAMKQYDDAVRTYRRVEDNAADYALYQTGQALNLDDQPQAAIDAFQRLVQRYGDSRWRDEALYRIGFIHFQEQNYGDAIDAYQRLISAYPASQLTARAQYGIGDAHFNAGALDAAVDAYRTVLEEYPRSAFVSDAASGIQYALISLDDPDRAEAIIDAFAAANPNSPIVDELRFRLAEALYRSGQQGEALAAFRQFVRTSSDADLVPEAYYYLGTIHAERDETDAAEGYLRQVVFEYEGGANRLEAARLLGDLYLEANNYGDAERVYRQTVQMADTPMGRAEARYGQSMALMNQGELQTAEQLLEEALAEVSDTEAASAIELGLARIAEQRGNIQTARDRYRAVADDARGEAGAEALYRLGQLLVAQDEPRAAIETLSRMPTLFGGYPDWMARGYLTQAQAYRDMGQPGEAARLYDRVIRDYNGTPFAQRAATAKEAL